MNATLLVTALALGQVVTVEQKGQTVPPIEAVRVKQAMSAEYLRLVEAGRPFVVYVGDNAKSIAGVPTIRDDAFPLPQAKRPGAVYVDRDGAAYVMISGTTATDVRRWAGLGVAEPADPFVQSERIAPPGRSARPDDRAGDDHGPWLPKSEQDRIKSMWPEGVPFPTTLKFYRLPRASQSVSVTNSQVNYGFGYPSGDNVNLKYPYRGSGGLDFVDDGTARNVTGMALPPGGRIQVWVQRKPIFAGLPFGDRGFQQEVSLFWRFPAGTQMFDVLIRRDGDKEHIFTVRKREKPDGVWDDGASYFPDVPVTSEYVKTMALDTGATSTARNIFGVSKITFKVAEVRKVEGRPKFKEYKNTVGMTDGGHFFPPGFVGAGVTCNKCHGVISLASVMSTDGEKSPYSGPSLAGNDTVYSFYPVSLSQFGAYQPAMDYRWPIEVVQR